MKTKDSSEEANRLAEWCRVLLGFLTESGYLARALNDDLGSIVADLVEKGDAKGLRIVQNDLRELAGPLKPEDSERLDQILANLEGPTKEKEEKEISRILEDGRARTEDEYRLVARRIEEIYEDPAREEEVRALDKVLARWRKQQ